MSCELPHVVLQTKLFLGKRLRCSNPRQPSLQALLICFLMFIFIYVTVFCQHASITTCVPDALRGQKRVLDPLKMELRMLVSHSVGDG